MFYNFNQNNSGGYFIKEDELGIGSLIIIEADSVEEARKRFEEIGETCESFYDFCPCCGDRWSHWYLDENDGKEKPMLYDEDIYQVKRQGYREYAFIHRKCGKIEYVKFK